MMKKWVALLAAAVLLFTGAAAAQEDTNRVFDYAGLFTGGETARLEAAIEEYQTSTGYDFAILVSDFNHGYDDYQLLCDDFYNSKSLGLGMNHTAIICCLDLYDDEYYYVAVYGDLIYLMDEGDVRYLAETAMNDFYEGDFLGGFLWTMDITQLAVSEIGVKNPNRRVYDYGDLLTGEERETLEAAIAQFRSLSGFDFLYLSTADDMDGNQNGDYRTEFYLSHGFGQGQQRSGAMVYLDRSYAKYYVQNFGEMDTLVTADGASAIENNAEELMRDGQILPALLQILDAYAAYFQ